MKTRSWASLAHGAAVIALFMILGAHGMLPTPASAQTGGSTTLPGGGSLMVSISSPAGGTTVTGTITVAATVSTVGSVTVQGVQFKLDGVNLGAQDTTAPYSVPWDTKTATNASHTLTAVARDIVGIEYTSEPVTVTVFNDKTPPTVAITAPLGGAFVKATVTVRATASDNVGVAGVKFLADGAPIGAELTSAPYSVAWDTTSVADGSHTLTAVARDAAGNTTTSAAVAVTVDKTPPTVAITAPAANASVSATVTVTASASDTDGVLGVQFQLDGINLGAEATAAPYSVSWDTTTATDGSHALTAVARDPAGNTATSTAVSVTVSQTATRFEDWHPSIIYTDGTTAPLQPGGWWHGSRSRGWSGRTASFNRSAGARATLTFTGTSVRWIGFRAPWAGIARVYVDGTFVTELDLYWPTELVQTVAYSATGLAPGVPHTFTVESTGRKNDSSVDYAVVVDAFDVSPASTPDTVGTRFEETALAYSGPWTQGDTSKPAWSGGTAAVAAAAGAQATFTFSGTEVRWFGLRGPTNGIARVYLDGAFHATVDTYFPSDVQGMVFAATNLLPAQHTLTVQVTGTSNAAATGTRIVVDALDVRARFEEVHPSVTYTPDWSHDNAAKAWSGTSTNFGTGLAALTRSGTATFTFSGTGVSWIGFRAPSTGIAHVTLDGVSQPDVDTYAPAEQVRAVLFTASGLADTTHTLTITASGQRNPSSIDSLVFVDAFDVTLSASLPTIARVQEIDPAVAYTDGWTAGATLDLWTGEHAAYSMTTGARATFTFTGTSVRWIGQRAFAGGIAHVYLDGVQQPDVDTLAPVQEEFQAVMFTATGLAAGQHTLAIEVSGQSTPGSQGVMVVVDAFDVQ
ncbi:MAG: hypothetical protein E6K82_00135 [Candidatus Rokuibacteriota bacterium]|nr:MAG: hypothetical protein E6K82_00135 [Candidatus Rokubacteria bacterium]